MAEMILMVTMILFVMMYRRMVMIPMMAEMILMVTMILFVMMYKMMVMILMMT